MIFSILSIVLDLDVLMIIQVIIIQAQISHAIAVVKIEENTFPNHLEVTILNSWGEDWGKGGLMTLLIKKTSGCGLLELAIQPKDI